MSITDDISTMSADSRRIELARLLASGLIRALMQRNTQPQDDEKESAESSADGLDHS